MVQDRTWLLIGRKMANEASPQELKELEEILKGNPELHFSLQALADLWQHSPQADVNELESAYLSHLARMKSEGIEIQEYHEDDFVENTPFASTGKRFISHRRTVAGISVFAAVLILIAGSIFLFSSSKTTSGKTTPVISEVSARYGSKTNIVLPDGSRVWLNAGSKLTYDNEFGESVRGVSLTGEAYFDVIHDASRPFVIHTTAMEIKVLGTEFNVKSYPDESTTEASLIRGSIEVTLKDRRAEKIILKPNEKLIVNNERISDSLHLPAKKMLKQNPLIISLSHLNYFSLDSAILETSWVNNRLIFEDESFAEVAAKMARWYGVAFEFNDDHIQKVRFTGNFKDETVIDALKAMQITANFTFRINEKKITISKK